MTAPGPPDSPASRRAARAQREEADRRVREEYPDIFSPFVLPAALTAPAASRAPAPPAPPESAPSATAARRAARVGGAEPPEQPVRHARRGRRLLAVGIIAALVLLLLGLTAAITALVAGRAADDAAVAAVAAAQAPPPVSQLPVPTVEQTPVSPDICAEPAVVSALETGDDAAAIAAAGGAEWFRIAVAGGDAPCIDLADPTRIWVVINKTRQYDPVDYWPADLMFPDGVRSLEGGSLRADASAALTAMVTAARDAGVGEIALMSGFRSFPSQMATYGRHVDSRGVEGADLVSARPGYSEHQSGLAADVVPCAGPCGTLDDLAASAQGEWVAAHSWEYGWIARYVDGSTDVSGYLPEPWHLRYIGPELARAYHDGGWKTLEEFFGLPPAPTYVG